MRRSWERCKLSVAGSGYVFAAIVLQIGDFVGAGTFQAFPAPVNVQPQCPSQWPYRSAASHRNRRGAVLLRPLRKGATRSRPCKGAPGPTPTASTGAYRVNRCKLLSYDHKIGRGGEIRTRDLLVPNQALYQAKLHPDIGFSSHADPRCVSTSSRAGPL